MLSKNAVFYQFEKTARVWLVALNDYTDEQFARKPAAGQWSIGQVYYHLVVGTENFHLRACQKCIEHQAELVEGGKTLPGKIVFGLGSFPPAKVHVPPSPQYTPKQPQSRARCEKDCARRRDWISFWQRGECIWYPDLPNRPDFNFRVMAEFGEAG